MSPRSYSLAMSLALLCMAVAAPSLATTRRPPAQSSAAALAEAAPDYGDVVIDIRIAEDSERRARALRELRALARELAAFRAAVRVFDDDPFEFDRQVADLRDILGRVDLLVAAGGVEPAPRPDPLDFVAPTGAEQLTLQIELDRLFAVVDSEERAATRSVDTIADWPALQALTNRIATLGLGNTPPDIIHRFYILSEHLSRKVCDVDDGFVVAMRAMVEGKEAHEERVLRIRRRFLINAHNASTELWRRRVFGFLTFVEDQVTRVQAELEDAERRYLETPRPAGRPRAETAPTPRHEDIGPESATAGPRRRGACGVARADLDQAAVAAQIEAAHGCYEVINAVCGPVIRPWAQAVGQGFGTVRDDVDGSVWRRPFEIVPGPNPVGDLFGALTDKWGWHRNFKTAFGELSIPDSFAADLAKLLREKNDDEFYHLAAFKDEFDARLRQFNAATKGKSSKKPALEAFWVELAALVLNEGRLYKRPSTPEIINFALDVVLAEKVRVAAGRSPNLTLDALVAGAGAGVSDCVTRFFNPHSIAPGAREALRNAVATSIAPLAGSSAADANARLRAVVEALLPALEAYLAALPSASKDVLLHLGETMTRHQVLLGDDDRDEVVKSVYLAAFFALGPILGEAREAALEPRDKAAIDAVQSFFVATGGRRSSAAYPGLDDVIEGFTRVADIQIAVY